MMKQISASFLFVYAYLASLVFAGEVEWWNIYVICFLFASVAILGAFNQVRRWLILGLVFSIPLYGTYPWYLSSNVFIVIVALITGVSLLKNCNNGVEGDRLLNISWTIFLLIIASSALIIPWEFLFYELSTITKFPVFFREVILSSPESPAYSLGQSFRLLIISVFATAVLQEFLLAQVVKCLSVGFAVAVALSILSIWLPVLNWVPFPRGENGLISVTYSNYNWFSLLALCFFPLVWFYYIKKMSLRWHLLYVSIFLGYFVLLSSRLALLLFPLITLITFCRFMKERGASTWRAMGQFTVLSFLIFLVIVGLNSFGFLPTELSNKADVFFKSERFIIWRNILTYLEGNWLSGMGINTYRFWDNLVATQFFAKEREFVWLYDTTHSMYMNILMGIGLLGVLLILVIVTCVVYGFYYAWRIRSELVPIWLAGLALLLGGLAQESLYLLNIFFMLALVSTVFIRQIRIPKVYRGILLGSMLIILCGTVSSWNNSKVLKQADFNGWLRMEKSLFEEEVINEKTVRWTRHKGYFELPVRGNEVQFEVINVQPKNKQNQITFFWEAQAKQLKLKHGESKIVVLPITDFSKKMIHIDYEVAKPFIPSNSFFKGDTRVLGMRISYLRN